MNCMFLMAIIIAKTLLYIIIIYVGIVLHCQIIIVVQYTSTASTSLIANSLNRLQKQNFLKSFFIYVLYHGYGLNSTKIETQEVL